MIKTLIAQTSEVDDAEAAVADVLGQLDLGRNLKKNSVGIIACYLEYIDNGIVKSICEKLPFSVAGVNTMSSATAKTGGPTAFSLAVLTSDDVFFSAEVSGSLASENKNNPGYEEEIKKMYEQAAARLPESPSLIFAFAPISTRSIAGDNVTGALDKLSGGVPVFGLVPSDFTTQFRNPLVIFGGEAYGDALAVILISGPVEPRFTSLSVHEENILRRKALVTSAEGNIIKEINYMPALRYGESIGLVENGNLIPTHTTPFMLYNENEVDPVARAVFGLTPEGHFLMGGLVPEGSTIGVGTIGYDDVINMAVKMAESAGEYNFLLVASCMSRNFILEWDSMAEIEFLQSAFGENAPFLFAYAAGEICPVRGRGGALINRYHNLTLASCAL